MNEMETVHSLYYTSIAYKNQLGSHFEQQSSGFFQRTIAAEHFKFNIIFNSCSEH